MIRVIREGGDGSGNFGHAGRPGEVGGSQSSTAVKEKPIPVKAPGAEEYSGSIAPWDMKADAPPRYPGDTSVYSPALPDANGNYPLGRRLQGTLIGKPPGQEAVLYTFIPGSATPEQLQKLENIIESNSDHAQLHPGEIAFNENGQLTKIAGNNYWIRGNYKDLQALDQQLTPAVKAQFGDKSAWSVWMTPELPDGTKMTIGEPTTHLRVVVPFEKDTPPNTVGTPIVSEADRDKMMSVMSGDEGRRVWQHADFNGLHIATDIPFADKDYYRAAIRELGGEEETEGHHDQHNTGATRFIPKDVNIEDYPVRSLGESNRMIRVREAGNANSGDHGHVGRKGLRGGSGPPRKETLVKHILESWNAASEDDHQYGEHWYKAAHAFALGLAHKYGLTLKQTAGIIAALSPQTEWARNMTMATEIAENGKTGGLGNSIKNALAIKNGADPDATMHGSKTLSFYHNILDPDDEGHVTIDRHAVALAVGKSSYDIGSLDNKGHYEAFVAAYKEAASQMGVKPNVMQGVTWSQYRHTLDRTSVKDTVLPKYMKEGGAGSGDYGHADVPGVRGGSAHSELAKAQRGAPEDAMRTIQQLSGGGVLDYVVEHAGDLTNRMAKMEDFPDVGKGEVEEKARRVINTLDSQYGFEREMNENLASNHADVAKVNEALSAYADAHAALPVVNDLQALARDVAVDIGRKRWASASSKLHRLYAIAKGPKDEWARQAFANSRGTLREGGEGSGNFGHAGRKGEVGGSQANDVALSIAQKTIHGHGGSFSTHGEPDPTSGYMVAEDGHERTAKVDSEASVVAAVRAYMNDKSEPLDRKGVYLGTWIEQGSLFMDNSHNIQDRATAFKFAHDNNQLAVYNVNTGEVENTMEDGKRPNETDAKVREADVPVAPHKFFFKGVTPEQIGKQLWDEYTSREDAK